MSFKSFDRIWWYFNSAIRIINATFSNILGYFGKAWCSYHTVLCQAWSYTLKCVYRARRVSDHVGFAIVYSFVVVVFFICFFLLILKLFWPCDIFGIYVSTVGRVVHFIRSEQPSNAYIAVLYPRDSLGRGASWPWSYGSWIYNYLCNQYLSPRMLWVRISIRARCTILWCDKVCQWLATGWWFSPSTPISSTNKTDRHDIAEILLKVVLRHHQTNTWVDVGIGV